MTINRRQWLQSATIGGLLGLPSLQQTSAQAPTGDKPAEGPGHLPNDWPDDPYLQGNFGPVFEEITADRLKIIGTIPEGLNGLYVRNGPNPQFPPKGDYHWFDGDGMLHGVRIRDGRASYRNRWVRTLGFRTERKAGQALWGGLNEPPSLGLTAQGLPPYKNTANTSVVWHDGQLMALWEGGDPHVISVPDLGTVGPTDFDGRLKHPFTAHPKIDPKTGELFCFGYQPVKPYLRYSMVDPNGELQWTTPIELPKPVMMHDFAITERFAIFMDLPATFDYARMLKGEPFLRFEAERPSRFGILPRYGEGADIRWFESPSCYVFHTLNAYSQGDEVHLIGCRYSRYPQSLGMGGAKDSTKKKQTAPDDDDGQPRLYRWRFHMATGAVEEEPLDELPCEFPRINDTFMGRKNRFGYAMTGDMGGFLKIDLQTGSTTQHRHGRGRFGGEGVFVPKPDARAEDQGWLITYIYDQEQDASEMVIIDAQAFDQEPVARIVIPQRVPYGFHGTWIDDDV